MDFFDFQKIVLKEDKKVLDFLNERFELDEQKIFEISKNLDITKTTLQLSQREIDKLYRLIFSGIEISEPEIKTFEEQKTEEKKSKKVKRKWYERWYYWFITSDGYLVIRGKNNRHNSTILRKYVNENNVLFFDNLKNPIFTVLKNDKNVALPPTSMYEAAAFACAFSSTWKQKEEKAEIFYVYPNSLRLNDRIEIVGEVRKIEKIKPKLSIGILKINDNLKIIYGPPTAVKSKTDFIVTIVPGDKNAKDLAKEIKLEFKRKVYPELVDLVDQLEESEIQKIIPFGKGEIVR